MQYRINLLCHSARRPNNYCIIKCEAALGSWRISCEKMVRTFRIGAYLVSFRFAMMFNVTYRWLEKFDQTYGFWLLIVIKVHLKQNKSLALVLFLSDGCKSCYSTCSPRSWYKNAHKLNLLYTHVNILFFFGMCSTLYN